MISAGSDTWKYYVYLSAPFLQAEQPVSQLVDFICSRILTVHSTGEPVEVTVKLVRQLPPPSKSLEYFLEPLILRHDPKHQYYPPSLKCTNCTTASSLRGRPWKERKVKMSAILPRPIFSRFTRSSFPFPSPSDACHAG